jgi:polyhydroxybutyrate depolymerase
MKLLLAALLGILSISIVSARDSLELELKVDGIARSALVFPAPALAKESQSKIPLVLCYHGHGGNALQASRSFRMHEAWNDALVVYPQGLPTPGQLIDIEGKRNGWQAGPGDQGDRDLHFFDLLLVELRKRYPVDAKKIFVMGHSNGGGFTYLLWAQRGKDITAVAPCAAAALRIIDQLTPKPCLHLAATNDTLVRYAWQEKMMTAVKQINRCQENGKTWAPDVIRFEAKDQSTGAPLMEYIHQQGHRYPDQATALMVRFFREISSP